MRLRWCRAGTGVILLQAALWLGASQGEVLALLSLALLVWAHIVGWAWGRLAYIAYTVGK